MPQSHEELKAKQRAYAKANQPKRNAYMREYRKRRIPQLRGAIMEKLGSKCANCGIADVRVLTIDHREGFGTKHRRRDGDVNYYRRILRDLDGFRLLCWNCNWLAHRYGPQCLK